MSDITERPSAADLQVLSARHIVWEATVELKVAVSQSGPSDDRIIMDHVKRALALLETIRT